MARRLAALALAALLLPQLALAEQARIALFEGVARAGPSADAAALQTFPEGAQVSVSEESQGGWRRIRLADGKVGWIEERALAFGPVVVDAPVPPAPSAPASTPPAPPAPPAAPPAAADLRPRIYVKDLDHLAELVKSDAAAGPKARKLAQRRTAAYVVGGLGLAITAAMGVYAMSEMGKHSDLNDPRFGDTGNASAAMGIGIGTGFATVIAAIILAPKRGDLLDVINAWNVSHPDQQFTIQEHTLGR